MAEETAHDSLGSEWLSVVCERARKHAYGRGGMNPILGKDDPDLSIIKLPSLETREEQAVICESFARVSISAASSVAPTIIETDDNSNAPSDLVRDTAATSAHPRKVFVAKQEEFEIAMVTQWIKAMMPDTSCLEPYLSDIPTCDPFTDITEDTIAVQCMHRAKGDYDIDSESSLTIPYTDYRYAATAIQRLYPAAAFFHSGQRTMPVQFRHTTVRFPSLDGRFDIRKSTSSPSSSSSIYVSDVEESVPYRTLPMAHLDPFESFWEECESLIPKSIVERFHSESRKGMMISYFDARQSKTRTDVGIGYRIQKWETVHGPRRHKVAVATNRTSTPFETRTVKRRNACLWEKLVAVLRRPIDDRSKKLDMINMVQTIMGQAERMKVGMSRKGSMLLKWAFFAKNSGNVEMYIRHIHDLHDTYKRKKNRKCDACRYGMEDGSMFLVCSSVYDCVPLTTHEKWMPGITSSFTGKGRFDTSDAIIATEISDEEEEDEGVCHWSEIVKNLSEGKLSQASLWKDKMMSDFDTRYGHCMSEAIKATVSSRAIIDLQLSGMSFRLIRRVITIHDNDGKQKADPSCTHCEGCDLAYKEGTLVPAVLCLLYSNVVDDESVDCRKRDRS